MSKFQKELFKYIREYQNGVNIIAPHFKYGETTYLTPEIAQEIAILYQQVAFFQDALEKERDYSRLLKKENLELQEELENFYSSENNLDSDDEDEKVNPFNNNNGYGGGKEYLA